MTWPWRRAPAGPDLGAQLGEIQAESRRVARQLLRAEARWEAMEQGIGDLRAAVRELRDRPVSDGVPEAERQRLQLALAMLDVVDGVERAFDAMGAAWSRGEAGGQLPADRSALLDVLRRVHGLILRGLGQAGVAPMPAEGQVFDPRVHRAVGRLEAAGRGGQVVAVDRSGYTLDGQVLRYAEVVVGVEPGGGGAAPAAEAGDPAPDPPPGPRAADQY